MPYLNRILLAIIILLPVSSFANSFKAKITNTKAKLNQANQLQLQAYLPSVGRIKLKLTRKNEDYSKIIEDLDYDLTLFKGNNKTLNSKSVASASILKINDKFIFLIYLPLQNRLGKNVNYKVLFELQNDYSLKDNIGRVLRSKNLPINFNDCNSVNHSSIEGHDHKGESTRSLNNLYPTGKQVISLEIDADPSWYNIFGRASSGFILSIINDAEVIYSKQLNIEFKVKRINIHRQEFLDSRYLELYSYYLYRSKKFSSANIKHLFLAKNLKNGALGVAYVGALCRSPNYAIGVSRFSDIVLTSLTFAHELGHNLGASHTTQMPNDLMSSSLSSDRSIAYFSNYSIAQINNYLHNFNSCLAIKTQTTTNNKKERIRLISNLSKLGVFSLIVSDIRPNPNCNINILYRLKTNNKLTSMKEFALFKRTQANSSTLRLLSPIYPYFQGKITFKAEKVCSGQKKIYSNQQTIRGFRRKNLKNNYKKLVVKLKKSKFNYF